MDTKVEKGVQYFIVDAEEGKKAKVEPTCRKCKCISLWITLGALKVCLLIFVVVFIIFPLIFKNSYTLQKNAVFLNYAHIPSDLNLSNPEKYGLEGVRNFHVTTDDNITLGVWQILPENLINSSGSFTDEDFDRVLDNGQDVIIYNHGNSGTRATKHRVEMYKVLRKYFHVITYDYRSYGDSSNVDPTEAGLVEDVKFMFNWVSNKTKSRIFLWGHSLGTGVSTHALALLERENKRPYGLILESPFSNMKDEVAEHPVAKIFKPLPWFHYTVINPMQENNLTFKSDEHIKNIKSPILILHAEDDKVVPAELGRKLYNSAYEDRREDQGSVSFHLFTSDLNYGHKEIYRSPILGELIESFVANSIAENKKKSLN